jgi:hypothetical protein
MTEQNYGVIYQEKIPSRLIIWLAAFLGLISLTMLGLVIYSLTVAPIDNDPDAILGFLIEFVAMGAAGVLVFYMRSLNITLTYDNLIVGFGPFRKTVPWSNIESYYAVTGSNYTSGGLHFGPARGGWGAAYTVMGKQRISLRLQGGTIKELVFSVNNPGEVLKIIKQQTGKDADKQSGR